MSLPRITFVKSVNPGYTVGIKRRFFPGYTKFRVKAHSWESNRFILNLVTGEQIQIPGFQAPALKVYSDFWEYNQKKSKPEPSRLPESLKYPVPAKVQGATVREDSQDEQAHLEAHQEFVRNVQKELPTVRIPEEPVIEDHVSAEARRRASERVRGILQSNEFQEQVGSRSY